jgi:hypothetical protein
MLKKPIRAVLRKTLRWLAEAPMNERKNYDQETSAYPRLNAVCLQILQHDARRPNYVWGVVHGAHLAKALGIKRISVIELGVAGGNGLLALQHIAEQVEKLFSVDIEVYGFDTGEGLPSPQDYRDTPNLERAGDYLMDLEKLQPRLKRAQLLLGSVADTVPQFLVSSMPPIAFLAFDLDLYSSTMQAFQLLEAHPSLLLPRIQCYFDDIFAFTYGDCNGELRAIAEFNAAHELRKVAKLHGLRYYMPKRYADEPWGEKFYLAHIFDHDLYGCPDGLVIRRTRSLNVR